MFDRRNVIAVLALAAILASLAAIVRSCRPAGGRIDAGRMEEVSELRAEAAVRFLKGTGTVAVVAFDPAGNRIRERQLEAFVGALSDGGLVVHDILVIGPEEIGDPALQTFGIPARRYLGLCEQHPRPDAVVSLAGAPLMDARQLKRLGQAALPVLVVDGNLAGLAGNHPVVMAVVPRQGQAPSGAREATTTLAWFEQTFEVWTR